jgi:hypothetical protein
MVILAVLLCALLLMKRFYRNYLNFCVYNLFIKQNVIKLQQGFQ